MGDAEIPYWQDYQVRLLSKYIDHLLVEFYISLMKNIVKYGNIHPIVILRKMPFGEWLHLFVVPYSLSWSALFINFAGSHLETMTRMNRRWVVSIKILIFHISLSPFSWLIVMNIVYWSNTELCYKGRHNVAYSRESDDVMISGTNAGNEEGGLAYKRGMGHSAM